jgi:hypothetical protein
LKLLNEWGSELRVHFDLHLFFPSLNVRRMEGHVPRPASTAHWKTDQAFLGLAAATTEGAPLVYGTAQILSLPSPVRFC